MSSPASPDPAVAGENLDASLVSSLAWSAAAKWSAQAVSWVSTILVARLLTPEDFGIMGMATLFIGVVAMLSEMGVGLTVVVLRDLDDEQLAQLNSVAVVMGVAGAAITLAAAQPLSAFFRTPELANVVRVLALTFVLGGFRSIPLALLKRGLRFKVIAANEAASSLATAATVVTLAFLGFGYWSLALGQIALLATSTLLFVRSQPTRFERPRWIALQRAFTFSKRVIVGSSAWFVYSNADFLVAGRVLGAASLGVYSFSWNLITTALEKIGSLVNAVTPAYFAALQRDPTGLRRMLLGITEALAMATFPVTVGIALVAADLVPVAFGDRWIGAVPVIQVLSLFGALRALRPPVNNLLLNVGEERFMMWIGVLSAVVFPLGFLFAARWGPIGIAAAWIALFPIISAIVYWRLFTRTAVRPRDYLRALVPSVTAVATMSAAVLGVRLVLLPDASAPVRLGAAVVGGAATYALTLWFGFRPRLEPFLRVAARARRKSPAPATAA